MPAPLDLGVIELAVAVRSGEIKAEHAVEASLARIESRAGRLGTFVEVTAAAALDRARAIDRTIARGDDPGPLAGVPIANKELFFRGGGAMNVGSPLIDGSSYRSVATVTRRLTQAGAIDLGRLAMAELALSPVGDNRHFGPVRNPWDETRMTGGSSSGSGAAVADRQVAAALGSDTAGSIRLPAALCGVTGIMPTHGRVSRAGVFPLAPSLDSVGPLAASARDCAAILAVIAGPDPADPSVVDRPAPTLPPNPSLRGRRLAYARHIAEEACTPAVAAAADAAVRQLAELGATVVETDFPLLDDLAQMTVLILGVEADTIHRRRLAAHSSCFGRLVRERIAVGRWIPGPAYRDALRLRAPLLRLVVAEVFRGADALVLPTTPAVAPTIAEAAEASIEADDPQAVQELAARLAPVGRLTRPFNFLGLPALSMPVGRDADGLPIGLQLVGRPFAEAAILSMAAAYQAATEWHRARPPA